MAVIQPVVDKLVPILAAKSPNCRTTVQAVLDIVKEGKPEKDAEFVKRNYPVSVSYAEEWGAAGDFSSLEVLPSLPEIAEALELFRLVDKKSVMKPTTVSNGDDSGINLMDIQPVTLQELAAGAAP